MNLFRLTLAAGLFALPLVAWGVDESPLQIETEKAFPNLRIRRPIVVTHAGDGSGRLFVAEQQGVIRFFDEKNGNATLDDTTVFLDIEDQVQYADKMNEEGLLGFAFHPKFKENGQFFIYYTNNSKKHTSYISRFTVKQGDFNQGDPTSEEVLMTIDQPFWNHNGGTLEFGPDGFLYIALGDGGKRDDPLGSGQDTSTLLGSILRIDVDSKSNGLPYGIPADNPFVNKKNARAEIYAHGVRNIWRLSFDRKTGHLWAADVGQDIWEEINIIQKGGNYGWNLREAAHKFVKNPKGSGPRDDLIDPIWEYNHEIGKSITGGVVYRGDRLPELQGHYIYADYVTGKIWALKYDFEAKKVISNRSITDKNQPVITFGEGQDGEVYLSSVFGYLYRFKKSPALRASE